MVWSPGALVEKPEAIVIKTMIWNYAIFPSSSGLQSLPVSRYLNNAARFPLHIKKIRAILTLRTTLGLSAYLFKYVRLLDGLLSLFCIRKLRPGENKTRCHSDLKSFC